MDDGGTPWSHADPGSGLKIELSRSEDDQVHFPTSAFRADDIDGDREHLVGAGMETSEPPQRRDFARMFTSFLTEGGVEVQLVKYDE